MPALGGARCANDPEEEAASGAEGASAGPWMGSGKAQAALCSATAASTGSHSGLRLPKHSQVREGGTGSQAENGMPGQASTVGAASHRAPQAA